MIYELMHTRNGIIKQIPKCMFIIYVSTANDKKKRLSGAVDKKIRCFRERIINFIAYIRMPKFNLNLISYLYTNFSLFDFSSSPIETT